MEEKHIYGICPVSGLTTITSKEYTNFHIKDDFYSNFQKIGDNIIYMHGNGNISNYEESLYQARVDQFAKEFGVKEPLIIIRNTIGHTGKVPLREIKKYRNYINSNQEKIKAVIFISNQKWLKIVLSTGLKFFSSKVGYFLF